MSRRNKPTLTRRTVLSAIGTGLSAGVLGAETTARQDSQYVLVQGDECVPIEPISGDVSAEEFYDYQLPQKYVADENGGSTGNDSRYASAGTTEYQRKRTSIAFLYRGPEGLSLVVVHGSTLVSDGGSVTFEISGLPEDGEWVVKDDLYRNPDTGEKIAYDRWNVDGTDHRIDWTWGSSGTDGGAFRGLGDDFEVVVSPSFNGDANLDGEYYDGTVTDWEFLYGSADDPDRVSLDMAEPIRIATGSCEDVQSDTSDGQSQRDDGGDGEAAMEDGEEYTVCHRPPGNPDNARTIRVGSESALDAHLDHGDSRGPCPGDG